MDIFRNMLRGGMIAGLLALPFSSTIAILLKVSAGLAWIVPECRKVIARHLKSPAVIAGFLFVIWVFLRAIDSPANAHFRWHTVVHFAAYFMVLVLGHSLFNKSAWRYALVYSLVALALFISLIKIAVFHPPGLSQHAMVIISAVSNRVSSVQENSVLYALVIAYLMIEVFYRVCNGQWHVDQLKCKAKGCAAVVKSTSSVWREKRFWLYAALQLLLSYMLLELQNNRVGIVVFFLLSFFLVFQLFNFKKSLLLSICLMVVFYGLSLSLPGLRGTVLRTASSMHKLFYKSNYSTSVGQRGGMLKNGLRLWADKPWLGYGTGTFSQGMSALPTSDLYGHRRTPENNYLSIALQQGLIGLGLLLVWMGGLYYAAAALPRFEKILARTWLVGTLLAALSFPTLTNGQPMTWLVCLLSACFGARYPAEDPIAENKVIMPPDAEIAV